MLEQAFHVIDDVLRRKAGCSTDLDYTEQTSPLLFLKSWAIAVAVDLGQGIAGSTTGCSRAGNMATSIESLHSGLPF